MNGGEWKEIAAPIPADAVQWRQQGKPKARGDKWFAIFVAYIDAQFVRDRLDSVVPGEWQLQLELLPSLPSVEEPVAFKARLTICGVSREDVGTGTDYKNASTDAFKRAAVRFGIAHELYTDYEVLSVQVSDDSKFAKPVEDPADVFARKQRKQQPAPRAVAGPSNQPTTHVAEKAVPRSGHITIGGKPLDTLSNAELQKFVRENRGNPKADRHVAAADELLNNRALGIAPPKRDLNDDEAVAAMKAKAEGDDRLPF